MKCLDDKSRRPSAEDLLNTDFLQDLNDPANDKQCEIIDNVKAPKTKKKMIFRNPMPDIPEEEKEHSQVIKPS